MLGKGYKSVWGSPTSSRQHATPQDARGSAGGRGRSGLDGGDRIQGLRSIASKECLPRWKILSPSASPSEPAKSTKWDSDTTAIPPQNSRLGRFMIGVVEDERAGTSHLEARPIHNGTEACGSRSPRDGGRNPVGRTSNHGSLRSQTRWRSPGSAWWGKRMTEDEERVDVHILLLSKGERKHGVRLGRLCIRVRFACLADRCTFPK